MRSETKLERETGFEPGISRFGIGRLNTANMHGSAPNGTIARPGRGQRRGQHHDRAAPRGRQLAGRRPCDRRSATRRMANTNGESSAWVLSGNSSKGRIDECCSP